MATPPLPSGTQPPSKQARNHQSFTIKGNTYERPTLHFKKLQPNSWCGERELKFYKEASTCEEQWAIHLRPLLPEFHGEYQSPYCAFTGLRVKYCILEKITTKFVYPCVLDVKVGARTYDPLASPDEIVREKAECPWKAKTGFSLTGLKAYNPEDSQWTTVNSHYLSHIEETEILYKGLDIFFNRNHPNFNPRIVEIFIEKVERIQHWFEQQRKFSFYSSSILFVYDAAILLNSADQSAECSHFAEFADARMFDFAHVFPSVERDDNYISGLLGIIQYFRKVARKFEPPGRSKLSHRRHCCIQ